MFMHEIKDEQDAINFCIQGVENNNDINDASWQDWDDAQDIITVYMSDGSMSDYREMPNADLKVDLNWDEVERGVQKELDYWTK